MESKQLTVYKKDIQKIGHTTFEGESENTCFICDQRTSNIEEILLREILDLYGYQIEEPVDWTMLGSEEPHTMFITDMPWEEYMALKF